MRALATTTQTNVQTSRAFVTPKFDFSTEDSSFPTPVIHRKASCACGGGCPQCVAATKIGSANADEKAGADKGEAVYIKPHNVGRRSAHFATQISRDHILELDANRAVERIQSGPISAAADQPPPYFASSLFVGRDPNLGEGKALMSATRAHFEPRYGVDLGHVRVHTGKDAAQRARDVRADAYTHGADIVFGRDRYSPGTASGDRLLAHELAHVVQQTAPAVTAGGSVRERSATLVLARSVDQWLRGSVHISAFSYTELVSEIDELNQWLQRQTTSSEDTSRIEETLTLLRAEVNRRDTAAAGPRTTAARRTGRKSARTPVPRVIVEPLPARYPRILTEMTSVMYGDPAEMRVEYDLIMQWLTRPELSAAERRTLDVERGNLAPQLNIDRERVVSERHAERVRTALTSPDPEAVDALTNLARTIEGIVGEPSNPSLFFIYHKGERIAISREQAESLRNNLHEQLRRSVQRIDGDSTYYWRRYHAQVALNEEHPVIAGISGWLADVEDPGLELAMRYFRIQGQVTQLRARVIGGDMVGAAIILPDVENSYEQIRSLARAYYEGYIEGAEIAVHRLEFTRNASFAIAGSIAAVVAAPVVAGFVGAGGLGLTGVAATATTIGGTGVVVGTGMATVRGTSAATGTLLAGGSLSEAGAAFKGEALTGFREGFLSGAGGAAARSIGLAIGVGGSLTRQVAIRVGGEMLINGTTAMVEVLARGGTIEEAARAGLIGAVQAAPGALVGGSNNPVVRNLLAPFTAAATSYSAARLGGASSDDALAQAGVALASNIAMSRAMHTPEADAALVERGRSMGARARETAGSTPRSPVATEGTAPPVDTAPPVSEPPRPARRLGGATAEGVGPEFAYETFPPTRIPDVEYGRPRPGVRPRADSTAGAPSHSLEAEVPARAAAGAPRRVGDLTPAERDMLADAIDRRDLSGLPPDLRRRAEIAEAHAEASGRSYEGEEGPRRRGQQETGRGGSGIPTRPFDLPEIREAALSAQAALASLPPGSGAKAVGGVEAGSATTSGSAGGKIDTVEHAREAAVEAGAVREHPFDRATGGPGYYHGAHAEIQTIIKNPGRPVAVRHPRGMCTACQDFFRRHAATIGERLVVADNINIKIFLEDGSMHETPHSAAGEFGSTSALPESGE